MEADRSSHKGPSTEELSQRPERVHAAPSSGQAHAARNALELDRNRLKRVIGMSLEARVELPDSLTEPSGDPPTLEGALEHIAAHGSGHTEAIVTDDEEAARAFVSAVQSSTVLVNASTRFADGGELGLGAEIGISTSKLHAYGPMGAKELTTRKFVVFGEGQVRS